MDRQQDAQNRSVASDQLQDTKVVRLGQPQAAEFPRDLQPKCPECDKSLDDLGWDLGITLDLMRINARREELRKPRQQRIPDSPVLGILLGIREKQPNFWLSIEDPPEEALASPLFARLLRGPFAEAGRRRRPRARVAA